MQVFLLCTDFINSLWITWRITRTNMSFDNKKSSISKEMLLLVAHRGFEPRTLCLKGRCSTY